MRAWVLTICILALTVVGGCKEYREIAKEEGMFEVFTLNKFPGLSHVYQENQEIFFHVDQPVNQGWFGENQIKLVWSKQGKLNMATVSLGNITFVADATKEIPTFKFTFLNRWLNRNAESQEQELVVVNSLRNLPPIPNDAIYGVTIRLNRKQYMDFLLALIPAKEED